MRAQLPEGAPVTHDDGMQPSEMPAEGPHTTEEPHAATDLSSPRPTETKPLRGKSVLITGGAHGLGEGLARAMAARGAVVTIADLDVAQGKAVAAEIGGQFVETDVTSLASNRAAVSAAQTFGDGLHIAVLNAGVTSGIGLRDDFDEAAYRRVMAVNLDGVVFGMVAAQPAIKESGGGDILVTASMAGIAPTPFDPIYAANKTAVVGLVRSYGLATLADGIRTNAVCPAFADTKLLGPMREGLIAAGVPLLTVDEVVAVYFDVLAAGDSGQCWYVQPGRPSEPFGFRRAPGPRTAEGTRAAAADPDTQFEIEQKLREDAGQ